MKRETKKLLTDAELELMQALWDRGQATVREIMEALSRKEPSAYTTVATVMKVLEKKGVVAGEKTDRTYLYRPLVSRAAYEAKSVRHIVDKVFRGTPSSFVMKLLSETKLSPEEIKALKQHLEKAR